MHDCASVLDSIAKRLLTIFRMVYMWCIPTSPFRMIFALVHYRIDGNGVIKVSDFGLTEDMYGTNYFRRKGDSVSEEKVPLRWMAPKSIERNIYSEASDVVSFIAVHYHSDLEEGV